jgi:hypothetical protein
MLWIGRLYNVAGFKIVTSRTIQTLPHVSAAKLVNSGKPASRNWPIPLELKTCIHVVEVFLSAM